LTYTPAYLAEKILTSRSALEGERKQVTVLFADLKGSMELLADRDPEEARQLLDPVLERLMAAVHRYEGTVTRLGRLSWVVAMYYAGINTSKMCSQLWPWANSCSTSLSNLCNASRVIVRTRCPMVISPCANANLSVTDPEAGVCWSNDCATQRKRKWRLTAS